MRDGNRLSAFFLLMGFFYTLKTATSLPLTNTTMLLMGGFIVLWTDIQMKHAMFKYLNQSAMLGLFIVSVGIFNPSSLPFLPQYGLYEVASTVDLYYHESHWITGFFSEMYAFAVTPEKLDFNHWFYLSVFVGLITSESLRIIHKSRYKNGIYGAAMVICGLLWFSYLDVWFSFGLLFIAFAMSCLTEQGKGLIFGAILPLALVFVAAVLTAGTPVEKINESLSTYTTENPWFRSALETEKIKEHYGIGAMGFYPLKDQLGGPVSPSKALAFRIKGNQDRVYLKMNVMTQYENNQWSSTREKVEAYKPDLLARGKTTKVSISDLKLDTNVVPSLMGTYETSLPKQELLANAEGVLWQKKTATAGGMDHFQLSAYSEGAVGGGGDKRYLQLPKGYSQKVIDFTRELTAGETSDANKIQAIKKYLLTHYTYTLAVKVPPKNQDFVEYILFDEREGYCVYFATAMTIMARTLGIPSRYAEGFVTPGTLSEDRSTEVTGEWAHAWSEIYYDSSWHIVEATPSYAALEGGGQDEGQSQAPNEENNVAVDVNTAKVETDMTVDVGGESAKSAKPWYGILGTGLMLLGGLAVVHRRLGAYYEPKNLVLQNSKTHERFLCERYTKLILLGLEDTLEIAPNSMTVREILAYAENQGLIFDQSSLVEIMEQSLYDRVDSPKLRRESLAVLTGLYGQLNREHFRWQYRLWRDAQIAWKGRLTDGSIDG